MAIYGYKPKIRFDGKVWKTIYCHGCEESTLKMTICSTQWNPIAHMKTHGEKESQLALEWTSTNLKVEDASCSACVARDHIIYTSLELPNNHSPMC